MVIVINIIVSVILLSGVVMTMVGLPGNMIIVLTAVGYGYYNEFQQVSYFVLAIVGGLFVLSEVIEFVAGALGAKKEKASKRAIIAAFLGTFAGGIGGTLILPIIGSIIGALVGAFASAALAEYTKEKDEEQAKRVALGVLKGQIFGMILKTTTAVAMVIILMYQLPWH